ncbi:hypothetical protein EDB81DRAFT_859298 [Dactylonectria macrodidyma]|uniref:Oxidoreductase acuF-like C2H2 type zinc-finger domain-containing protein n=1 Tax=Dactylonectria macrodidyma TaxID=307937 RepID=A0A9P9EAU1_9HYPO|nr:hypothetical protein EDB81DRAFT_859298 [Dactylonectria macrodidyma]
MLEWQQEPKESILKKTRQVKTQFQSVISSLDKSNDAESGCVRDPFYISITDALGKFVLWAGNLGALRGPPTKLSLDHRLSSAPEVRDEILRQLDDISEAIEDLLSIVLGTRENGPSTADLGTESQLSDESQVILEVISESISSLFRIGILVRRATPRDRFKRALQDSALAFPTEFDVKYVEEKHHKLRANRISARLGAAIAKRRQFIMYCRDHRSRLGLEEAVDDNPTAQTEKISSKATTFAPGMDPKTFEIEEDDALSYVSASTMTNAFMALRLPSLADLSKDGEPFECPICFTLQSFQKERAWKKHAFCDLKAYVCTVGGTKCDDLLFGDSDSWFAHEMNKHRATYNCSLCDQVKGASSDQLRSHLATHSTFNDQQLDVLEDTGRDTAIIFRARDCPFCDEWADKLCTTRAERANCNGLARSHQDVVVGIAKFKRHVAAHHEQLAIFALPRAPEDEQVVDSDTFTCSMSFNNGSFDAFSLRDGALGEHGSSSHLPEHDNNEGNPHQLMEPDDVTQESGRAEQLPRNDKPPEDLLLYYLERHRLEYEKAREEAGLKEHGLKDGLGREILKRGFEPNSQRTDAVEAFLSENMHHLLSEKQMICEAGGKAALLNKWYSTDADEEEVLTPNNYPRLSPSPDFSDDGATTKDQIDFEVEGNGLVNPLGRKGKETMGTQRTPSLPDTWLASGADLDNRPLPGQYGLTPQYWVEHRTHENSDDDEEPPSRSLNAGDGDEPRKEQLNLDEWMPPSSRNTLDNRTEVSDGLTTGTTWPTRSEDGGEDFIIKVGGSSVVRVSGAEVQCVDGAEMTAKSVDSTTCGGRLNASGDITDSEILECPELNLSIYGSMMHLFVVRQTRIAIAISQKIAIGTDITLRHTECMRGAKAL